MKKPETIKQANDSACFPAKESNYIAFAFGIVGGVLTLVFLIILNHFNIKIS